MSRTYEAPELKLYGSVAALTASGVKCSPGFDGGMGGVFGGTGTKGWSYDSDGTAVPAGTDCSDPVTGPFTST